MKIPKLASRSWRYARVFILALLTPLFEKNPSKMQTLSRCRVPMVLSMARIIVLLFAAVMMRQIWVTGIGGWPEATLTIAIVLALPLLSALERVNAQDVLAFSKTVASRFGIGAVRTEPSKFDDHRDDRADDRQLKVVS